jgi:hypothetical protein
MLRSVAERNLPTVQKIQSLWASMPKPETTEDVIVSKRQRRGQNRLRHLPSFDANMQGLSGDEDGFDDPAVNSEVYREELQINNTTQGNLARGG